MREEENPNLTGSRAITNDMKIILNSIRAKNAKGVRCDIPSEQITFGSQTTMGNQPTEMHHSRIR